MIPSLTLLLVTMFVNLGVAVIPPCATMDKANPPSCLAFYSTKPAIVVPGDNAMIKYGILRTAQSPATFTTRDGKTWKVKASAMPKIKQERQREQWIVKANFTGNVATSFTSWLFIPSTTKLGIFVNTTLEAKISGLDNVQSTYIRFDMDGMKTDLTDVTAKSTFITGNIVNLNRKIKSGQSCQKSLYGDVKSKAFFQPVIGNGTKVTLWWDPAMHAPGDSEWVIQTSMGVSYMTRTQPVLELMLNGVQDDFKVDFFIHGNPMDIPAEIKGVFGKKLKLEVC